MYFIKINNEIENKIREKKRLRYKKQNYISFVIKNFKN